MQNFQEIHPRDNEQHVASKRAEKIREYGKRERKEEVIQRGRDDDVYNKKKATGKQQRFDEAEDGSRAIADR